jgi:hypothetical protein
MNTNTQEALAKVASLSSMLEDFAQGIAAQKINIYPIGYEEDCDILEEIELDEADGENLGCCCTGCMDCLDLHWSDFA